DYNDFVPLDSLTTADNAPFPLAPGMVLEYWLEARDNCDYPDPRGNLGASKRYKLTIGTPKNKTQADGERSAARQQQRAHQQKQDQSLADQNTQAAAEGGKGEGQQDRNGLDKK